MTPKQPEFINGQTARYDCKRCDEDTIVSKDKHVHEHKLCEDCYAFVQPFLDV